MALIRYSSIIADASGNIGGINFLRTKSGPVARIARKSTRQLSAAQLRNQSFMNIITKSWNALTDEQRLSWQTSALQTPSPNALGLPTFPTGRQLYFSFRLRFLAFDNTFDPVFPPFRAAPPPILDLVINTTAPSSIEIAWTIPASVGFSAVHVYGARSYSDTPSKFFTSHKVVDAFAPASSPIDISSVFATVLGVPQSGELISIKTIVGGRIDFPGPPTLAQTHMA